MFPATLFYQLCQLNASNGVWNHPKGFYMNSNHATCPNSNQIKSVKQKQKKILYNEIAFLVLFLQLNSEIFLWSSLSSVSILSSFTWDKNVNLLYKSCTLPPTHQVGVNQSMASNAAALWRKQIKAIKISKSTKLIHAHFFTKPWFFSQMVKNSHNFYKK